MKSDTASKVSPPRHRRKETRPQELLQAALELFVEKGFAATRAEEVAHQAGVSKGTLYLYYPSKEELFKAVVRHNVVSLIAQGREMVEQFEGFEDFQLLRPTEGEDRYFVYTRWASEEHFQAWMNSQDFAHGHASGQKTGCCNAVH